MKKPSTGALTVLALAMVSALMFVCSRSMAVEAAYPVEKALHTFSRSCWTRITGFFNGAAASAENVRLKRELQSLEVLRSDIDRLETENSRLRRALGYTAKNPMMWLPAEVLSRGGAAAAEPDVIRVNKGEADGVEAGAIVIVPEGLVGKVISVTAHTARIMMVTDSRLKVACEVECGNKPYPHGIISGGTDEVLVIRHFNGEEVPVRSRVVTSGVGGVFPKGLEIGRYLSDGEVLPAVEYSTIEDVFIRREK